ncbi:MAG TPA: hypothetical protein VGO47_02760 [Chlamydiales bacterium]|nr:hypothetical protein [Chlamydiales bacterium]
MQKLTNLFSSYTPEDDDEEAIARILFPPHTKATTYFIEFTKYQNRVSFDDRAFRWIVKEAIPTRIRDELRFAREDIDTFEGFREAVLRIDNEYWKRKKDDANRQRLVQSLPGRYPKSSERVILRLIENTLRCRIILRLLLILPLLLLLVLCLLLPTSIRRKLLLSLRRLSLGHRIYPRPLPKVRHPFSAPTVSSLKKSEFTE